MKNLRLIGSFIGMLAFFLGANILAWADDMTVTPSPTVLPTTLSSSSNDLTPVIEEDILPTPEINKIDISKPKTEKVESEQEPQTIEQNPSQGEGEKAPMTNRSTAAPEFSLPDVVITGENELTIGAKRLDRQENDVTLGAHDLTGLDRSVNDLPGLNKTMTALSTEDVGSLRDSALILHLGGGNPGTYGGWGLLGQEFNDFQYLLSGDYSNWDGEPTALGRDGENQYGFGLDSQIFQTKPLNFILSANYTHLDVELPYQSSIHELHTGIELRATANEKLSDFTRLQFNVTEQQTELTSWDAGLNNGQVNELTGIFQFSADEITTFLKNISLRVGGINATSTGLPTTGVINYELGWLEESADFDIINDSLRLKTKIQEQAGNGFDLSASVYPSFEMLFKIFEDAQLEVTYSNKREVDNFFKCFMDNIHISDTAGFALPSETENEFGTKLTKKFSEQFIFSIFSSEGKIRNYHQWTDLVPGVNPVYIQTYSTIGQVQLYKAGTNFQWDFERNWTFTGEYQWIKPVNLSDARNFTNLPMNQFLLSLLWTEEKWDVKLETQWSSQRDAFETISVTLPAYWTVGFHGEYHADRALAFWLSVDNLLGQDYQIQPGYEEPEFDFKGGVEISF
jgi:hypothetical protein